VAAPLPRTLARGERGPPCLRAPAHLTQERRDLADHFAPLLRDFVRLTNRIRRGGWDVAVRQPQSRVFGSASTDRCRTAGDAGRAR
jgi:hypothetical protein